MTTSNFENHAESAGTGEPEVEDNEDVEELERGEKPEFPENPVFRPPQVGEHLSHDELEHVLDEEDAQ